MPAVEDAVTLYVRLAQRHEQLSQLPERDRFLILAADAASRAGRQDEAERLRQRLLAQNPHHLLKPYKSWLEAMATPDVVAYVQQLRRQFPQEQAEQLLRTLPEGSGPKADDDLPVEEEFTLPMDAEPREIRESGGRDQGSEVETRREGQDGRQPSSDEPAELHSAAGRSTVRSLLPVTPQRSSASASPGIFRLLPEEPAKGKRSREKLFSMPAESEPESVDGAWVGSCLFAVLLVASIAWLAYVALGPLSL